MHCGFDVGGLDELPDGTHGSMSDSEHTSLMADVALRRGEGNVVEARRLLLRAIEVAQQCYGPDDLRVAEAMEQLVEVDRELGYVPEAQEMLEQAVQIRLKRLSRRGHKYRSLRQYIEAEKLYRESIVIAEKHYGPNHRETAVAYTNLAACLRRQTKLSDAIEFCKKAMAAFSAMNAEESREAAYAYSESGFVHRLLKQLPEAERLFTRSLEVLRKIFPGDHPSIADTLDRLAMLRKDQERFDEAKQLCQQALDIRKAKLGPEHPLTKASEENLSWIDAESLAKAGNLAFDKDGAGLGSGDGQVDAKVVQAGVVTSRERHGVGCVIVLAIVCLAGLLAGVYFAVPVVIWLLGIGIMVITAAIAAGMVSYEELLLRLWQRIMQEPELDKDAVVLGGDAMGISMSLKKPTLTVQDARILAKVDPLELDHITSLTLGAAEELAKLHVGVLKLNGIGKLSSKLARALSGHRGALHLNGAVEITEPAAAQFRVNEGDLFLGGLLEVTVEMAKHLAHHRGYLSLSSVRSLDENSASWLIKHRGGIDLTGLRLAGKRTIEILRTKPDIEFPDHLANGG
jgi:tetratricopeptide (TPR) repeat protein